MVGELDFVARFACTKQFNIRPRTIFVEGTTDVGLFQLAANLEREKTGLDLLGDNLAIVAAGEGDYGGAKGVCRELVCFKNLASTYLLPNGRPKYRFIGLFDNDRAGRQAVHDVRNTDTSILEYKDVFRLRPVMPLPPNRDPGALQKSFDSENQEYKQLDWELEDLLSATLVECFLKEYPQSVAHATPVRAKVHRDWTPDGKARLHHFAKQHAIRADLVAIVDVLRALRYYLGMKPPDEALISQ